MDAYAKWLIEKSKRNEQTYNDMLRTVREEVVNGRPLLQKLRNRYDYAIIDEFQDTNQIQWDIFSNVFLCDNHHLTVVGDPKQSIYAFQGADLSVFNKARDEIVCKGGVECKLNKNYRSTKKMIDSVNKFFQAGSPALTDSNSFSESECGNEEYDVKYSGCETTAFWIGCKASNEETQADVVDENEYAGLVCQTIVDCCSYDKSYKTNLQIKVEKKDKTYIFRNVNFSDFAILARTKNEMEPVEHALEKAGIPFIRYKDESLFKGIECTHWIAVLEAIDTPDYTSENIDKFKKALFTKFFGYSLEALSDKTNDGKQKDELKQFNHWKLLAKNNAWEEMIDDIIISSKLKDNLGTINDINPFNSFKQIGEHCIEYLSKVNNISALISHLKKLQKEKDEEYDEENGNVIAQNTDFPCVKVMTVHASKGLEFPVVISAAGFKKPRTSNDIYNYHNAQKRKVLSFRKGGAYDKENSEEWQRIFYVAYTRAKYILMLPYYEPLYKTKNNLFNFISASIETYKNKYPTDYRRVSDNGETFDVLKCKTSKILQTVNRLKTDANPKERGEEKADVSEDKRKEELKKLAAEKPYHATRKYSYSNLTHKRGGRDDEENEDGETDDVNTDNIDMSVYDTGAVKIDCEYDNKMPVELSQNFPAGADLGNALHDIFEVIDYEEKNFDAFNGIIEGCFKEYGFDVKEEWVSDVRNIIKNILGAKLPTIHGSKCVSGECIQLGNISFDNRKNEVEFNYNKEPELLKDYFNGFIDLVFRQGEYYSILDWKSDRLNDDDLKSYNKAADIKERVDKHYSIQRVLYAYILIKWLKNFYPNDTEKTIFEKHFGGVYYVFLRGCNVDTGNGIYAQTWKDYAALQDAYKKIISERITGEDDVE